MCCGFEGLPEDVRVIAVEHDVSRAGFVLTLQSSTYDEVPLGARPPEMLTSEVRTAAFEVRLEPPTPFTAADVEEDHIDAVGDAVGMAHGGWGDVNPCELIAAAWNTRP